MKDCVKVIEENLKERKEELTKGICQSKNWEIKENHNTNKFENFNHIFTHGHVTK